MIRRHHHRYIALSDLHLVSHNPVCRRDNLIDIQWEKLDWTFNWAQQNDCDVLIAGDLHAVSNSYPVLNRFAGFLREWQAQGVNVYCIYGQHDMKYRNTKDTNLEILINSGLVNLCGDIPYVLGGAQPHRVWGAGWQDNIPNPSVNAYMDILLIHAPISPKELFHGHEYIDAWAFLYEHQFDIVICGDVHRTFILNNESRICLNSGPLLRREADEYNFEHKPGFYFIDVEEIKFEWVEVPHAPAEDCLTRAHIDKKNRKKLTAARADTSRFLYELKSRAGNQQVLDIKQRMIDRITDDSMTAGAKEVITHLLNQEGLDTWLNKDTKR